MSEPSGHSSEIHPFPGGELVVSPVLLRGEGKNHPGMFTLDTDQPEPTVRQRIEDEYSGLPSVKIIFTTRGQASALNRVLPPVVDNSYYSNSIWTGNSSNGLVVSVAADEKPNEKTSYSKNSWSNTLDDLAPIITDNLKELLSQERTRRTRIRKIGSGIVAGGLLIAASATSTLLVYNMAEQKHNVVRDSIISGLVYGVFTGEMWHWYTKKTENRFNIEYTRKITKARQFSKLITETAKKFIKVNDTTQVEPDGKIYGSSQGEEVEE